MPGENLEVEVGGGEEVSITPPREIARAITEENLIQKTWLTQENKEGVLMGLAYNQYLKEFTGVHDDVLDELISNMVVVNKSVDGQTISALVGLAGAIHQQPSTNVNIGETLTSKMGGKV